MENNENDRILENELFSGDLSVKPETTGIADEIKTEATIASSEATDSVIPGPQETEETSAADSEDEVISEAKDDDSPDSSLTDTSDETKTEGETVEDVKGSDENPEEKTGVSGENSGSEAEKESEKNEESPEKAENKSVKRINKPYHERAYLNYGNNPAASEIDLKGTKSFLNDLGFDGGELRQARMGKELSGILNATTLNEDGNSLICSYCGTEITGIDYERLPDGRLRCNTCGRTKVRNKDELNDIFRRVISNLEAFFGAAILTQMNVEMLEERKLKKKIKHSLGGADDRSVLILGVAVNRKKEFDIYLENGLPRLSAVATFAHELTHIWQYTHWDAVKGFPKLDRKARLLVYEGMAKWVEIQYLYLIGEVSAAKREEDFTLTREDEYGIGFRLYSDRYPISREAMICEENPFTTDSYPIS